VSKRCQTRIRIRQNNADLRGFGSTTLKEGPFDASAAVIRFRLHVTVFLIGSLLADEIGYYKKKSLIEPKQSIEVSNMHSSIGHFHY
jgi:hypothetical protein